MKHTSLLHQSTSKHPPNNIGVHSGCPGMSIASSSVSLLSSMEKGGAEQNSSSVLKVALYKHKFGPNRAYRFIVDNQRAVSNQTTLTLEAMS